MSLSLRKCTCAYTYDIRVCVKERVGESIRKKREREREKKRVYVSVCVRVCVYGDGGETG